MSDVFAATIAPVIHTVLTGRLRWRQRLPSEGPPGRELQQEVQNVRFVGGVVDEHTFEWRDVASAAEDKVVGNV